MLARLLFVKGRKNNKLNLLWHKLSLQNPPEKVYVCPSFASFPRHIFFLGFPNVRVSGGGKRLLLKKFMCLRLEVSSDDNLFFHPLVAGPSRAPAKFLNSHEFQQFTFGVVSDRFSFAILFVEILQKYAKTRFIASRNSAEFLQNACRKFAEISNKVLQRPSQVISQVNC